MAAATRTRSAWSTRWAWRAARPRGGSRRRQGPSADRRGPPEPGDFSSRSGRKSTGLACRTATAVSGPRRSPRHDGPPHRRHHRPVGQPWNGYGDRSVLGVPPAPLWATDPAGFSQAGCVYSAQGFEHEWSGVITGPIQCGGQTAGSWTSRHRRTRSSPRRRRTTTSTGCC